MLLIRTPVTQQRQKLEHSSAQADLTSQEGRAKRSRVVAAERNKKRRETFRVRRASVDRWADPEQPDPRATLTQEQLGAVNSEAMRMSEKLDSWSRAAISRRLAEGLRTERD